MEYNFQSVTIYSDKDENLILIPQGESQRYGTCEINLPTQLKAPYTDEELEQTVLFVMSQCFKIKADDEEKRTVMERLLKVKGWKKAVSNYKCIWVYWDEDEGCVITVMKKVLPKGYYEKTELIELGHNPKPGELAKAVRKAIALSTM